MARGVNKVILIGRLGNDPDVRYSPSGSAIANFSIATSEQWKDKATGEKQERTEWHRITAFGRLAEIAGEYLKKGTEIYLEGKLQADKWQDKNGHERYTTKIICNEIQMLGSRQQSGTYERNEYRHGVQRDSQDHGNHQTGKSSSSSNNAGNFDDFDGDIPF